MDLFEPSGYVNWPIAWFQNLKDWLSQCTLNKTSDPSLSFRLWFVPYPFLDMLGTFCTAETRDLNHWTGIQKDTAKSRHWRGWSRWWTRGKAQDITSSGQVDRYRIGWNSSSRQLHSECWNNFHSSKSWIKFLQVVVVKARSLRESTRLQSKRILPWLEDDQPEKLCFFPVGNWKKLCVSPKNG